MRGQQPGETESILGYRDGQQMDCGNAGENRIIADPGESEKIYAGSPSGEADVEEGGREGGGGLTAGSGGGSSADDSYRVC